MCGICGFTGEPDPTLLERMMRRLEHRGPDEEGAHSESAVSLGVRRLRVIDPKGGHQPMTNETSTIWVVLNGEIYNYRELKEELIRKGHRFTSESDTEVLVHLYEEEGEDGVHRLRGMFAYALWDAPRQTLLLVRDRLGIKPLYYAERDSAHALAFASELPALRLACPAHGIRPQAIVDYLTLLYVPGPDTIFEGIRQLPAGHLLKLADGRVEIRPYFRPESLLGRKPLAPQDAVVRFLEELRDSVRSHLVSDVPLGLFLSGGLDSGSILAMMHAVRSATNGPIRTFSIGYEAEADQGYNELEAARLMAARFDAEHTEERLRPDAAKLLTAMVAAMGEPFADASAIPTFLVSQLARRSVTVALSGIGGDELFGGYPRYLGLGLARRYGRLPRGLRTWIATHLAPSLPESLSSRNRLGRVKRFLRDGDLQLPEQYVKWMSFLPSEWGESALTPALLRHAEAFPTWGYRSRFEHWPSSDPADQAMGLDLQTYLPDDLLRMADRLSMAHSLELRVPFCDHQLLEFALAIPAALRFSGGRLKGFMRQALGGTLPPAILSRAKAGFQVPLARWLRDELHEMVQDFLSPSAVRRRGYVRPEYVQWLTREHAEGRRNCTDQIYALLVLELWHQEVEHN
jgi:asparagine synthase (glutamine-hydrolysing)